MSANPNAIVRVAPPRSAPLLAGRRTGRGPSTRSTGSPALLRQEPLSKVVYLFIVAILCPPETQFEVAGLVLSAQRALLMITLVPCLMAWSAGKMGPKRLPDWLILFHGFWACLSFTANHGIETGVKSGGILAIETVAPYFIARRYIRSPLAYGQFLNLLFYAVCFEAIFAFPEALTGNNYLRDGLGRMFGHPFYNFTEKRLGLVRAFGSLPHPIIYGLFCAMSFAPSICNPKLKIVGRTFRASATVFAAFLSVSSAAILAIVVQFIVILYERVTRSVKRRWLLFAVLFGLIYTTVDLFSSHDPITVIFSYLTFNSATGWSRQAMWEYGVRDVWSCPFLGRGYTEWNKPPWLPSTSLDNFWLLIAIRHGLPGAFSLLGTIVVTAFAVGRRKISIPAIAQYRLGWIIAISAMVIAGFTVDLWGSGLTFLTFFMGTAVWMYDAPASAQKGQLRTSAKPSARPVRSIP